MLHQLGIRSSRIAKERLEAKYLHLSNNSKTGISINVPIYGTCQPTKACKTYCYGFEGPIAMRPSLGKQLDNFFLLQRLTKTSEAEASLVALVLASDIDRAHQKWVRWNGVGDLIPGSVLVINTLVLYRPDITQWIVTRKAKEAIHIVDHPSIRLLLSLDESTPPSTAKELLSLQKHFKYAKVRTSWVRRTTVRPPKFVDIVFNEHHRRKRLQILKLDPRTCPATLPNGPHEQACNACQRCFSL